MKICGIITEYNPFHLGHEYQINQAKEVLGADYVIVVMSPNFVQRGEPAIFDQFTRTKLALTGGADVVIQLPTYFATASAETFSFGAVSLLHQLGVVDILCFGSESGQIKPMEDLAKFLVKEPANFKNALKCQLKNGYSYPKARDLALKATFKHTSLHNHDSNFNEHEHFNDHDILKGSNNILGIEYIKALIELDSSIKPMTIKRIGANYLSTEFDDVLPSASAIRHHFREFNSKHGPKKPTLTNAMPQSVIDSLMDSGNYTPMFMEDIFDTLKYKLELFDETDLKIIYDFNIQLFNRLKKHLYTEMDYSAFIDTVTTKNYTKTTIQRSLLHLYLNIHLSDIDYIKVHKHPYVRVLGFKKSASPVLHMIKETSDLPIVTNVKDHYKNLRPFGQHLLTTEIKYTNLYNQLVYKKFGVIKNNDYRQPVIVI